MAPVLIQVAEYACLFRGNTVLVLWLEDRSRALSGWHLPGGRLDEGEASVEGLCREIREEVGFVMDPDQLRVFRTVIIDPGHPKYAAVFTGDAPDGDVTMELDGSGKLKRHAWMIRTQIAHARFAFPELQQAALGAFERRS